MPRQAIFFLIDTQGINCVGCYAGGSGLGTPNVDALAADGILFEQAYTCAPVCGPARSAIFTGLYPHSNGVLGNSQAPHADIPSLGLRLSKEGIPAAYIGKWHLDGLDYFGTGTCPPGWEPRYWFDGRNYLESLPDDHARDLSRRQLTPDEIRHHGITSEFTHAHRTADRAIDFLRTHSDQDFLLVVSIDEPHDPYICPEPFASAFEDFLLPVPNADDDLSGKPRHQQEWAAHMDLGERVIHKDGQAFYKNPAYFGCNSFSDFQTGRVLAEIDRLCPDALVIYTSDHGDMFGSHGLGAKGPVMYEEITHIPFVVRWKTVIPRGVRAPGLVSQIDLVPTFLDFFGLEIPDLLQGRSLLPQFHDPEIAINEEIFMEFNRFEIDHDGFGAFQPARCVCDGHYKLVINLLETDELYDLWKDRSEKTNCIDDVESAGRRDALHDRLLAWMDATRDPLRGPHWKRRAWRTLEGSTWGGPTRPRPFDEQFSPKTLLYETGKPVPSYIIDKY